MFWSNRKALPKKISNSRRHRKHFFRQFEPLEDRRVLATLTVTTTIDRPLDTSVVTLAHRGGVDGKLTLREAIYLANISPGPDTVLLKGNSTYKMTAAGGSEDLDVTGDFDIWDNLTIQKTGKGSDPVVNGNGLDRVFQLTINGLSLTLNHVVVTGGVDTDNDGGGGIMGFYDENLTILNSSIKGNISTGAGGEGGGFSLVSGNVTIANSHIDNNTSASGTQGIGGAFYIDFGSGSTTITNSTINGNSAYGAGGGICDFMTGNFTLINSQINNNQCGSDNLYGGGGAIISAEHTTITNSTVSGNTSGTVGGGLFLDPAQLGVSDAGTLTITNSTFANNSAVSDGGAVWSDQGSVTISGSTFSNNQSTTGSGGALGNVGAVSITKSTFSHNVAAGVGGAIDEELVATIYVSGSTFTYNSAGDTGGAINGDGNGSDAIAITVINSKFTFNSSTNQGGAIAGDGESVYSTGSTFDHNFSVNGDGGAIDDAIVFATDSKFTYNTAKADGGAIDSQNNNITLLRCLFSCNTATNGEGGAFNDGGSDSTEMVTNCTIDGNTAGGNGGGFAAEGVTLTMTGCTVSNNRSGSEGGGAYIITNGANIVTYPSGPLAPASLIANCTFANNGSATDGGGIDFEGDGDLTIINVTIAFNSSFNGGGIAQTGGSGRLFIGNTIVAKNNATNDPDAYNPASSTFFDLGHNLVFSDPDNVFTDGSDLRGFDPKLGPLANNGGLTKTLALLKGSPAINAADDTLAPLTDQRGVSRPQGSHADIGAYEKK